MPSTLLHPSSRRLPIYFLVYPQVFFLQNVQQKPFWPPLTLAFSGHVLSIEVFLAISGWRVWVTYKDGTIHDWIVSSRSLHLSQVHRFFSASFFQKHPVLHMFWLRVSMPHFCMKWPCGLGSCRVWFSCVYLQISIQVMGRSRCDSLHLFSFWISSFFIL